MEILKMELNEPEIVHVSGLKLNVYLKNPLFMFQFVVSKLHWQKNFTSAQSAKA